MNYLIWDRSPEIFTLGPLEVRFYGLFFAIGFFVSYLLIQKIYKIEKKPLEDLDSLLIYIVLGTVVGARLGHCLFYNPSYYLSNPLEIIMFWKGGLASHGGGIGVLLALFIYSKRKKDQEFFWLVSRICIVVPFLGFLVRLGNFFNSEILGKETSVSWAVVFARYDFVPRHPVQIYESLSYFIIFLLLHNLYYRRKLNVNKYLLIGTLFTSVFSMRFLLEYFKMPQADFMEPSFISMGQILSIPFILIGLTFLYLSKSKS